MDYRQLPHGRSRRIAYSLNLENRRRVRQISSPLISQRIQIPRRQNINHTNILNISPIFTLGYIQLSNLEDVKIGLLNKNLLKNTKVYINTVKDFCVICQDEIKIRDIGRTITKCKHSYHIDCIDEWFIDNKKCPICKYVLE
jgi:hypothetical protein